MNCTISVAGIAAAAPHIDPVFLNSAMVKDTSLDRPLGCQLVAKVETQNPVGSFKGRGTELFAATALKRGQTVVCASAGNFGQGLARAAGRRGHACVVFAAENANPMKIEAMRRFGADVKLVGPDFDAAKEAAHTYASEHGLRFVEDGAEAAITAGAGTIGLELVASERFDAILVQLGNGALLAGVGTVLRELAPRTEIIAVVAANAPAMKLSLEAGRAVPTASANTIADGIAVRVPIPGTLELLRHCCDDIVAVEEGTLVQALRLVHQDLGLMLEPAGAAGIAAIMADPGRFRGRRIATLLSGGNLSDELRTQLLSL
ncbi:MAG: Threonine dehydratase [Gammaproteobacteria bacterium]|jgi:threonine dehydratase|nr:Threonine dehydratase [Gammaproteobacteria bacterium]